MNKKILAFDMDGTLTESRREISYEMINILEKLSKKYTILIITGGTIELIKKQILNLKPKCNLILYPTSGSQQYIYNDFNLKNIYSYKIKWYDKLKIFSALREFILINRLEPKTSYADIIEDRNSQITFSAIGRNAKNSHKDSFDPDRTIRTEWIKQLKEMFNIRFFKEFDIVIGGTTSIDFINKKYNKGKVIENFCRENHFLLQEVIYFGDKLMEGGNDNIVKDYCNTIQVDNPKDLLKKLEEY